MARINNHLERMTQRYINMAKKATSQEVRDECLKRAQMLRNMNYNRMIGETDAEYHRRRINESDITAQLQNIMKGREL